MFGSRTTRLLGLASVAALALTAACSSAGAQDNTKGKDAGGSTPVTLTFWGTYGNGGNKTQTDALSTTIVPAFEKANPGIKIKYVDIPYDSMLQKLTTSAAGGELPDLVRADLGWCRNSVPLGCWPRSIPP
jgi:multiple sugar transport system substrate-binding protein